MNNFVTGFISTAMSDAEFTHIDSDGLDGIPYGEFDESDLSESDIAKIEKLCHAFQTVAADLLAELYDSGAMDESSAGSDFYMTRVGHGVGFWDRGIGELGNELTRLAGNGEVYFYIDDSGKPSVELY